jgi:glucose/arabinose dehydrogenase
LGKGPSEGIWYVPSGGHPLHVVTGLTSPAGLIWVADRLYVASATEVGKGQVSVLEGFTGSEFTHHRVLLGGLPIGKHLIGSIAQGPEGRLFIGLGAPQDQGGPPGSVRSFTVTGEPPVVEATGVRTAYGLAFWGQRLLVTDNGPDYVAEAPDTLHVFEPSGPVVNFGFPQCYGQGGTACARFPAPLTTFPAHSTPEGIAVKGDIAFVAMYGSFPFTAQKGAPTPPEQPAEIVRVDLRTGKSNVFWRSPVDHDLLGLAIGPDGNLYATLFASGKVVRFQL